MSSYRTTVTVSCFILCFSLALRPEQIKRLLHVLQPDLTGVWINLLHVSFWRVTKFQNTVWQLFLCTMIKHVKYVLNMCKQMWTDVCWWLSLSNKVKHTRMHTHTFLKPTVKCEDDLEKMKLISIRLDQVSFGINTTCLIIIYITGIQLDFINCLNQTNT